MKTVCVALLLLSLACAKDSSPTGVPPASPPAAETPKPPTAEAPKPPADPAVPKVSEKIKPTASEPMPPVADPKVVRVGTSDSKSLEMFERLLPLIPHIDRMKARQAARQVDPVAIPKSVILAVPNKEDPYFKAYIAGFEEAASEAKLNASVRADQNYDAMILNQLGRCDVLLADAPSPNLDSQEMKTATKEGLALISWQLDPANPKSYAVRPATDEMQAKALVEALAASLPTKGEGRILLMSITRGSFPDAVRDYAKKTYPKLTILDSFDGLGDPQRARETAMTALLRNNDVDGVLCLDPITMTGIVDALASRGQKGKIKIVAIASPKATKDMIDDGTVAAVVYWNPKDLGYLAGWTAVAALEELDRNRFSMEAGRLGRATFNKGDVVLDKLQTFTKENISKADY